MPENNALYDVVDDAQSVSFWQPVGSGRKAVVSRRVPEDDLRASPRGLFASRVSQWPVVTVALLDIGGPRWTCGPRIVGHVRGADGRLGPPMTTLWQHRSTPSYQGVRHRSHQSLCGGAPRQRERPRSPHSHRSQRARGKAGARRLPSASDRRGDRTCHHGSRRRLHLALRRWLQRRFRRNIQHREQEQTPRLSLRHARARSQPGLQARR